MGQRFSPSKSEVVHFWRDIKGGRIREYPVIKLKGENIPRRESTRFLGMILDRALNWKEQITILQGETLRAINILRMG